MSLPPSPSEPTAYRRYAAELLGTFSLVLAVVGAAVLASSFDDGRGDLNIGFGGVALALGLTVLASAYAWGPISGGHFNPAVTVGFAVAGRLPWRLVGGYVVAQVLGGLAGASTVVFVAAGGPAGFLRSAQSTGFASTGWGELSPGGFDLPAAFAVELVTTALFVAVVLAVTGPRRDTRTAPIAIGLSLTVAALIAIPVSNGSFNPARSIATAVYGGPVALEQLWMSLVAPLLGGVIAGVGARLLSAGAAASTFASRAVPASSSAGEAS